MGGRRYEAKCLGLRARKMIYVFDNPKTMIDMLYDSPPKTLF